MAIEDNAQLLKEIDNMLNSVLPVKPGVNKRNELIRLIYEIARAENLTVPDIIHKAGIDKFAEHGKSKIFQHAKKALIEMRYPSLRPGGDIHIMPVKINTGFEECRAWDSRLAPKKIFIEKDVQNTEWTKGFVSQFPGAQIIPISSVREGFKLFSGADPLTFYNRRSENIFLIKHKESFIKICPCSRLCKRCGYWILNVGFGCPFDCTYCYLQMYSNAPGIVLPANIEDYRGHIMEFDRKMRKKTRIGTGEFTDSLAFDAYTGYSKYLIPFFRDVRRLVLELKTKSGNIDNILSEEPHENVVISWSVNPQDVIEKYEKGSTSMLQRIGNAEKAARHGYKIGFHFDPIIYGPEWEGAYEALIEEIFKHEDIVKNTVWISLGTLRYTPGLKQAAERRFADNLIFYQGEFFQDVDGKLRYSRKTRVHIYNKVINWLRDMHVSCWIYLCMELEEVWRQTILRRREYSFKL